jgi:hypothetical protein
MAYGVSKTVPDLLKKRHFIHFTGIDKFIEIPRHGQIKNRTKQQQAKFHQFFNPDIHPQTTHDSPTLAFTINHSIFSYLMD